jgi:uncharacterized membrane protein
VFIALFCLFCLVYPFAVKGTLLILAAALAYGPLPALIINALVFALSYLVEAIGVNTGIPFGLYHYTDILRK